MGPRRRRVVWSDGAFRELDEATEYVAQDSRQAAVRLLQRLLDAAESLSEFAERGRVVPELDDPSIRELQVNPYRLVFSVSETEVAILGVLHQRRDFDRWGRSDLG
jgi:plasmid stabilization system protein ParE